MWHNRGRKHQCPSSFRNASFKAQSVEMSDSLAGKTCPLRNGWRSDLSIQRKTATQRRNGGTTKLPTVLPCASSRAALGPSGAPFDYLWSFLPAA